MRLTGIPLFLEALPREDLCVRDDVITNITQLIFSTSRFKVPLFGHLWIRLDAAAFLFRGQSINREEAFRRVRPYIQSETSDLRKLQHHMAGSQELERIMDGLPLDDFFALVTGTLEATASPAWFIVDGQKIDQMRGDMDLPVTDLAPWDFWVNAEVVDIEPKRGA